MSSVPQKAGTALARAPPPPSTPSSSASCPSASSSISRSGGMIDSGAISVRVILQSQSADEKWLSRLPHKIDREQELILRLKTSANLPGENIRPGVDTHLDDTAAAIVKAFSIPPTYQKGFKIVLKYHPQHKDLILFDKGSSQSLLSLVDLSDQYLFVYLSGDDSTWKEVKRPVNAMPHRNLLLDVRSSCPWQAPSQETRDLYRYMHYNPLPSAIAEAIDNAIRALQKKVDEEEESTAFYLKNMPNEAKSQSKQQSKNVKSHPTIYVTLMRVKRDTSRKLLYPKKGQRFDASQLSPADQRELIRFQDWPQSEKEQVSDEFDEYDYFINVFDSGSGIDPNDFARVLSLGDNSQSMSDIRDNAGQHSSSAYFSQHLNYTHSNISCHGKGLKLFAFYHGSILFIQSKRQNSDIREVTFDAVTMKQLSDIQENPFSTESIPRQIGLQNMSETTAPYPPQSFLGVEQQKREKMMKPSDSTSFTSVTVSGICPSSVLAMNDPSQIRETAFSLAHTYHYYLYGPYGQAFLKQNKDGSVVPHQVKLPWHYKNLHQPLDQTSIDNLLKKASSSPFPLYNMVLRTRGFDKDVEYDLKQLTTVANMYEGVADDLTDMPEYQPHIKDLNVPDLCFFSLSFPKRKEWDPIEGMIRYYPADENIETRASVEKETLDDIKIELYHCGRLIHEHKIRALKFISRLTSEYKHRFKRMHVRLRMNESYRVNAEKTKMVIDTLAELLNSDGTDIRMHAQIINISAELTNPKDDRPPGTSLPGLKDHKYSEGVPIGSDSAVNFVKKWLDSCAKYDCEGVCSSLIKNVDHDTSTSMIKTFEWKRCSFGDVSFGIGNVVCFRPLKKRSNAGGHGHEPEYGIIQKFTTHGTFEQLQEQHVNDHVREHQPASKSAVRRTTERSKALEAAAIASAASSSTKVASLSSSSKHPPSSPDSLIHKSNEIQVTLRLLPEGAFLPLHTVTISTRDVDKLVLADSIDQWRKMESAMLEDAKIVVKVEPTESASASRSQASHSLRSSLDESHVQGKQMEQYRKKHPEYISHMPNSFNTCKDGVEQWSKLIQSSQENPCIVGATEQLSRFKPLIHHQSTTTNKTKRCYGFPYITNGIRALDQSHMKEMNLTCEVRLELLKKPDASKFFENAQSYQLYSFHFSEPYKPDDGFRIEDNLFKEKNRTCGDYRITMKVWVMSPDLTYKQMGNRVNQISKEQITNAQEYETRLRTFLYDLPNFPPLVKYMSVQWIDPLAGCKFTLMSHSTIKASIGEATLTEFDGLSQLKAENKEDQEFLASNLSNEEREALRFLPIPEDSGATTNEPQNRGGIPITIPCPAFNGFIKGFIGVARQNTVDQNGDMEDSFFLYALTAECKDQQLSQLLRQQQADDFLSIESKKLTGIGEIPPSKTWTQGKSVSLELNELVLKPSGVDHFCFAKGDKLVCAHDSHFSSISIESDRDNDSVMSMEIDSIHAGGSLCSTVADVASTAAASSSVHRLLPMSLRNLENLPPLSLRFHDKNHFQATSEMDKGDLSLKQYRLNCSFRIRRQSDGEWSDHMPIAKNRKILSKQVKIDKHKYNYLFEVPPLKLEVQQLELFEGSDVVTAEFCFTPEYEWKDKGQETWHALDGFESLKEMVQLQASNRPTQLRVVGVESQLNRNSRVSPNPSSSVSHGQAPPHAPFEVHAKYGDHLTLRIEALNELNQVIPWEQLSEHWQEEDIVYSSGMDDVKTVFGEKSVHPDQCRVNITLPDYKREFEKLMRITDGKGVFYEPSVKLKFQAPTDSSMVESSSADVISLQAKFHLYVDVDWSQPMRWAMEWSKPLPKVARCGDQLSLEGLRIHLEDEKGARIPLCLYPTDLRPKLVLESEGKAGTLSAGSPLAQRFAWATKGVVHCDCKGSYLIKVVSDTQAQSSHSSDHSTNIAPAQCVPIDVTHGHTTSLNVVHCLDTVEIECLDCKGHLTNASDRMHEVVLQLSDQSIAAGMTIEQGLDNQVAGDVAVHSVVHSIHHGKARFHPFIVRSPDNQPTKAQMKIVLKPTKSKKSVPASISTKQGDGHMQVPAPSSVETTIEICTEPIPLVVTAVQLEPFSQQSFVCGTQQPDLNVILHFNSDLPQSNDKRMPGLLRGMRDSLLVPPMSLHSFEFSTEADAHPIDTRSMRITLHSKMDTIFTKAGTQPIVVKYEEQRVNFRFLQPSYQETTIQLDVIPGPITKIITEWNQPSLGVISYVDTNPSSSSSSSSKQSISSSILNLASRFHLADQYDNHIVPTPLTPAINGYYVEIRDPNSNQAQHVPVVQLKQSTQIPLLSASELRLLTSQNEGTHLIAPPLMNAEPLIEGEFPSLSLSSVAETNRLNISVRGTVTWCARLTDGSIVWSNAMSFVYTNDHQLAKQLQQKEAERQKLKAEERATDVELRNVGKAIAQFRASAEMKRWLGNLNGKDHTQEAFHKIEDVATTIIHKYKAEDEHQEEKAKKSSEEWFKWNAYRDTNATPDSVNKADGFIARVGDILAVNDLTVSKLLSHHFSGNLSLVLIQQYNCEARKRAAATIPNHLLQIEDLDDIPSQATTPALPIAPPLHTIPPKWLSEFITPAADLPNNLRDVAKRAIHFAFNRVLVFESDEDADKYRKAYKQQKGSKPFFVCLALKNGTMFAPSGIITTVQPHLLDGENFRRKTAIIYPDFTLLRKSRASSSRVNELEELRKMIHSMQEKEKEQERLKLRLVQIKKRIAELSSKIELLKQQLKLNREEASASTVTVRPTDSAPSCSNSNSNNNAGNTTVTTGPQSTVIGKGSASSSSPARGSKRKVNAPEPIIRVNSLMEEDMFDIEEESKDNSHVIGEDEQRASKRNRKSHQQ